MTARDTPTVAALLRLEADMRLVTGDLRSTRIEHGLSQAQVSRSASISVDQLSRIERNLVELPGILHLAAVAAVLGMRLKVALYPEGEPVRDRVQVPGLAAFRSRLHASMAWRTEVVLPAHGDRRAWDAVVIDEDRRWTGIEWISRVGGVDGMLRRANQKQRDDARISSVVLVIADTARNRAALRESVALVRAEYPLATREVLSALANGHGPTLNGMVLLRIPGGRPHAVHTGGKVVDAGEPPPARFVENRLGRPVAGP